MSLVVTHVAHTDHVPLRVTYPDFYQRDDTGLRQLLKYSHALLVDKQDPLTIRYPNHPATGHFLIDNSDDIKTLSTQQASLEISQLRAEVSKHDKLYYNDAAPAIADAEYDKMFRRLENLEAAFPQFADPNSPTSRVGGTPLDGFKQVAHGVPMLSIDDLFTHEEVADFIDRVQRTLKIDSATPLPLIVEPKIDGVAISLIYENGALARAVTRGDGQTGDDITENVRTIATVPLILPADAAPPATLDVRGEIFMPTQLFIEMNERRVADGLEPFANPRNSTAGSLKLLDSSEVARRPLDFIAHGFGALDLPDVSSYRDYHRLLQHCGINHSDPLWYPTNLEGVLQAIAELETVRHDLPYWTDGAVIKVDSFAAHKVLGSTSRAPRWLAAFKYPAERKETVLRTVTVQVGRTGKLTPVAELEPVLVSGSTVSRATLHNDEEIERKDIRIGDTVIIEKAGEIIPAVVEVVLDKRKPDSKPFNLQEYIGGVCPSCGTEVGREEGFVAWRCFNFACPAQVVERIIHFAMRKSLDIDGVGESVAIKLAETGLVKSPLDLFALEESQLADLQLDPAKMQDGSESKPRRFGEKRAQTVLASLQHARDHMPLSRWLNAFGIANIGESSARELSRLHKTIGDIAQSKILQTQRDIAVLEARQKSISPRNKDNPPANDEEKEQRKVQYEQVKKEINALKEANAPYQPSPDVGAVASASVLSFLSSQVGQTLMQQMREHNINPVSDNYMPVPASADTDNQGKQPFAGTTMVITGTLSKPRPEFKAMAEAAGAKVTGSVTSKTTYLLAGEKAGSKLDKAEKLGIQILTEDAFMALLE